ncbi:GTP-binding protein, partial [Faecalibaculum rodentium]
MKHIVLSILAHVDAGKTTLIESLLYTAGTIRRPGRVDKQTTVLDDDIQERERGITIYAKEAGFAW